MTRATEHTGLLSFGPAGTVAKVCGSTRPRRILPTEAGRSHPLLAGRPASYDAPSLHSDEVDMLPPGAVLLAGNRVSAVQAAEIRFDGGVFWGVQYHPELSLDEVAGDLRREADGLVEAGLARGRGDVEAYARQLDDLHQEPRRRDLAWRLGLDDQVTDERHRLTEIRNFIENLARRGREGMLAMGK
jgi:GMP synthase (glutamine-hydrolysing)